jgi:hypothetical protein
MVPSYSNSRARCMANEAQNTQMTWPNQDTGANAGGPCRLPMRMRQAARVAQFWR